MRKLFILFAAVAFVFAFTAPAKADVNFSGYVAFHTYMVDVANVAPAKDSSDLDWTMDRTCSRLTINFKEGPVSAVYEIRPNVGSYVRHWFASWNFGAGTLGIGQFWTPEFSCISSAMYGCGALDVLDPACSVRIPFVQLQFGSLKIAAGEPSVVMPTGIVAAGYNDTETSLPKLMVSYDLNVAMVGLKLFGGYNSVDARNSTTDQTQGIDSYVVGLTASMGFGPLSVKAQVWQGSNPVEYGAGAPGFAAAWNGTAVVDASCLWYGLDLAYKVSDMITVTAGYMTGQSESDAPGTNEDPATTYHVNATITLAKGVTITPEYMVYDQDDVTNAGVKTEEASQSVMGVYWKIAF
ncbi:MAG TPA: hypothetical protein VMW89_00395 [Desulfatiglandales bacterium]|nr:hypothetical protein [Desulfatiglandales bacterium]